MDDIKSVDRPLLSCLLMPRFPRNVLRHMNGSNMTITKSFTNSNTGALDLFPNGAWDVHHHIFDPAQFAYAPDRHLTPPPATISQFLRFKTRVGITNSVLTHGLSYGDDCTSLKKFVADLGFTNTKGIAVIDPKTATRDELQQLHQAGIRGIRVNLYKYMAMHDVELQKTVLHEHARILGAHCRGWSMAFTHIHPEFWRDLKPVIDDSIVPTGICLITDHFALLKGASMLPPECEGDVTRQEGFEDIMNLVREGKLFVKLSAPYRVSHEGPDYEDLQPLVRAFVDANPRQVLWGSDWSVFCEPLSVFEGTTADIEYPGRPHTPHMKVRSYEEAMEETPYLDVDDIAWLKSLRSWLTATEWHALMVTTPRELYDW